ncbi:hypothetical protein EKK58_09245 [Candidatus Dependentiae bacterium]|nr:MAG: hypothetical protein EKK58_09245 [Candidatus Dependentiae bacterium]
MNLPYDYFPKVFQAVELIAQGRTKTYACDEVGITVTVFDNTVKQYTELQELLVEAETRGYDTMADMLLTIDSRGIYAHSDPKMAKVISDNIKWLLERRKSKQYGQRVQVEHNITADRAIINALSAGRRRVEEAARNKCIDVTPEQVLSTEEEDEIAYLCS